MKTIASYSYIMVALVLLIWTVTRIAVSSDAKQPTHLLFSMGKTDFVVPVHVLESPRNLWKPGKKNLPADLSEFGRKAKQHLLGHRPEIPTTVNLLTAEIRALGVMPRQLNGTPDVQTNSESEIWYLVFTFSNRMPDGKLLPWEDCTVGMMLDGSFVQTIKKGKL